MKSLILFIILFVASFSVRGDESLRRCMVLPIKDSVGGAVSFKVFKRVENYLKDSTWCYYQTNSEILNILSHYKHNLHDHLKNPEVLKLVASKTTSGSLIKIKVINNVSGVNLSLKVIADNGVDILFSEATALTTSDIVIVSRTIINWLEEYEKVIPYHARITGVLGAQFTIDMGKQFSIRAGDKLKIIRKNRKRRHPLFKEIIDWETKKIADGKIINSNSIQAQGKIVTYENRNNRVKTGDWVVVDRSKNISILNDKYKNAENDKYKFGKIGKVSFALMINSGSESITNSSSSKISGMLVGGAISSELWATRKYWVGLDFNFNFGNYSTTEGSLELNDHSMTLTKTKIKFGYKYLPLGFFFGPQLDGYFGYLTTSYGIQNSTNDGIIGTSLSGILMGIKGSLPVHKMFRVNIGFDFIFSPSYSEDADVYGVSDSASYYDFEAGLTYNYNPNMVFDAALNMVSSNIQFRDPTQEVSFKNTIVKVGATFAF